MEAKNNLAVAFTGHRKERILQGNGNNLFKNDGNNHLHGGKVGFDSRLWSAEIIDGKGLKLSRVSKDGEEGYPANLNVSVTYSLSDENALSIEYEASADGDTLCSLTNHAYFNLDGDFKTVLNHKVFIDADFVTAVDDELIPHGERKNILGTAFDFTKGKTIGKDIEADEHMLKIARGYDFNYVVRGKGYRKVATAKGEKILKLDQIIDQQAEIDSYLEETKLENIIRRASIDPDIAARIAPDLGGGIQDFTEAPQTLAELQSIMLRAEQIWEEVPKEIKLKFDNDVDKFISSYGTIEWAKNLGILEEKPKAEPNTEEKPEAKE